MLMVWLLNDAPIQSRGLERLFRIWIGDAFTRIRVVESGKTCELVSPARGDRSSQIFFKIAEKKKWRLRSELFAHEEHGRRRSQQDNCCARSNGPGICQGDDSFSECPISYLIVILEERDKCSRRQAFRRFATSFAISVKRHFALICESPNQATAQLLDRASCIVGIITILFAGDQYVQGVMDIVIPLRIV